MMDMGKAYAVIMAGGKGERFWPLSTARTPKQLLALVGNRSMLAMAVDRLAGLIPPERVLVITSAAIAPACRAAVPELPAANVIGEPVGRDTAAACALAAAVVGKRDPDGVFCILTADHVIGERAIFQGTLRESLAIAAAHDVLVTIGMQPTAPSTGFGYIEVDGDFPHAGTVRFLKGKRFVEKPDAATAERYIASGRFFWNAGMFVWSARSLKRALGRHRPQLLAMAEQVEPAVDTPRFADALAAAYAGLERISIDYAVMEKADNIVMAKGTFPWDDVGSWSAVAAHLPKDEAGNAVVGTAESIDAHGNVVVSAGRLTALIGVDDLVVVHTDQATLICPKARAQEVKAMVNRLQANGGYDGLL